MAKFTFEAIGTTWNIDIFQSLSADDEQLLLTRIQDRIEIFDKNYSRFRSDSLVTKMAKEAGVYTVPADAERLFSIYRDLYIRTNGFFTPFVGTLLADAGYDAQYSLQQKKTLEIPPAWENVMTYTHPYLTVKEPTLLDFGAGGKGYLIDIVATVLEENTISKYCINAGGDILYKNTEPIRIGLENPEDSKQVIGVYMLYTGSICGSAGNRRSWGNFTHIINPKTLISPTEIIAVWVVAENALLADALTTCLFFVEASTLLSVYTFEYLIIKKDHSIEKSRNFSAELFA